MNKYLKANIFWILFAISLAACNHNACYLDITGVTQPNFTIQLHQKNCKPLLRDDRGNYFIKVDSSFICTSTTMEEIMDCAYYFLQKDSNQYLTSDQILMHGNTEIIYYTVSHLGNIDQNTKRPLKLNSDFIEFKIKKISK